MVSQCIAGGFDGHSYAVFIPAAECPPALGMGAQPGGHPLMRGGNRRALHAQSRNIAAKAGAAEWLGLGRPSTCWFAVLIPYKFHLPRRCCASSNPKFT